MTVRPILQALSWTALAVTLALPVMYLAGGAPLEAVKTWLLAATVVWFVATPMWMGRE